MRLPVAAGLVPELLLQLAPDPFRLAAKVQHFEGNADQARLLRDRPADRVPDPGGGVGGEPNSPLRVETADGGHESEIPFLDEITEGDAQVAAQAPVAPGDGDDEPEMALQQPPAAGLQGLPRCRRRIPAGAGRLRLLQGPAALPFLRGRQPPANGGLREVEAQGIEIRRTPSVREGPGRSTRYGGRLLEARKPRFVPFRRWRNRLGSVAPVGHDGLLRRTAAQASARHQRDHAQSTCRSSTRGRRVTGGRGRRGESDPGPARTARRGRTGVSGSAGPPWGRRRRRRVLRSRSRRRRRGRRGPTPGSVRPRRPGRPAGRPRRVVRGAPAGSPGGRR